MTMEYLLLLDLRSLMRRENRMLTQALVARQHQIEILIVDMNSLLSDVLKDNRVEYMSHMITVVVESRNIKLLVIT